MTGMLLNGASGVNPGGPQSYYERQTEADALGRQYQLQISADKGAIYGRLPPEADKPEAERQCAGLPRRPKVICPARPTPQRCTLDSSAGPAAPMGLRAGLAIRLLLSSLLEYIEYGAVYPPRI